MPGTPERAARQPDLCSRGWDDLPALGSAPRALFWVAVEQVGAWGRQALTESGLDADVGRELERACSDAGGRAVLIRRVGDHRASDDGGEDHGRTVLVSGGPPTAPWLRRGIVTRPEDLLALPFAHLADPDPALPGFASAEPVLLVCTNGKRDTCCAVRGRPVARDAAALAPGRVWESSHTGGHRFAPTGVVLPTGQALAHLDGRAAAAALRAADAGRLVASSRGDRGRSQLSPPCQVADAWLRARTGETDVAAWTARETEGSATQVVVTLTRTDGATTRLAVRREESEVSLPESCGKQPTPVQRWSVAASAADGDPRQPVVALDVP